MAVSSVVTILASNWTDRWNNEFAIVLAELFWENVTFYPTSWLCGRLLPKKTVEKESKESLMEMLVVEGLDVTLRLICFSMALSFPSIKGWLTGVGSLMLDLLFLVSLAKSHRLLEIVRTLSSRKIKIQPRLGFGGPEFLRLGLSQSANL